MRKLLVLANSLFAEPILTAVSREFRVRSPGIGSNCMKDDFDYWGSRYDFFLLLNTEPIKVAVYRIVSNIN